MSESIRIEPDGETLQALAAAARRGEAWPPSVRVTAVAWGLRFEITESVFALPPKTVLAAIRGPYCEGCRRMIGGFSYTEWNVVEAEASPIPERCPTCGTRFLPPAPDALMVMGRVLEAALERAGLMI